MASPTKTKSIAQQDKDLMDLQAQIERKEAQLKEDYRRLTRDVKHNPDLQVAIDEYKAYFAEQKAEKNQQLKALSVLLKHIEANTEANAVEAVDTNTIKREIMAINRKK